MTRRRGFGRLRLRHKLALSLSLAALLPVVVASTVAVRIVLRTLEVGLKDQTDRQLRIAMNLVLRQVERLGAETIRLSSISGLLEALEAGEGRIEEFLARESPYLPSALIQVADADGQILTTYAIGDRARFAGLAVDSRSPTVLRGLVFERRVTLTPVGEQLVVRAVAPIVDPVLALKGVVVMSMPLDGDFADGIKGALGADVLIHAGSRPAMSTFLDDVGARAPGIEPPPGVAVDVLAGGTRLSRGVVREREYSLGYAPLKNLDGEYVGMLGVAVGRGALVRAQAAATGSLVLGAAGAFVFALGLAGLLSRRLTRPIARLHEGALAVARGDLDVRLPDIDAGDEIGDLADAFATMTAGLRENQERLAARMREIVALHEAGRAVSSVLDLDEVLRTIVDSIARVLDTRLAAVWVVERPSSEGAPSTLRVGAARARPASDRDLRRTLDGQDAARVAEPLGVVAVEVALGRRPLRLERVAADPRWVEPARRAEISGALLAVPLERPGHVAGVLVVGRAEGAAPFSDAETSLVGAFADQAATAIENARLYEEVRAFSEELEEKVLLRTRELTAINLELGRALNELRETQAQLVLSERMAGLGALVAGVAHEINSPSAAIRGSVDALSENVKRLARRAREAGECGMSEEDRKAFFAAVEELAPRFAERRFASPAEVRRRARELGARLAEAGIEGAEGAARTLAEIGAADAVERLLPLLARHPVEVIVGYLEESAYLHRNTAAIQGAIKQIQRIVGALKSYSHLDQAKVEPADLHEGIENTLAILHHELKYGISITRRYGDLPPVPVFVDELNQVWTNLIHNAVQALGGKGEIAIETESRAEIDGAVVIRVIDNGPGIPQEALPRIFEPFFTTKAKGEGTGLGLGIVRKIVDKHGGRVEVESEPGRTCFTVVLPVAGPRAAPAAAAAQGGTAT